MGFVRTHSHVESGIRCGLAGLAGTASVIAVLAFVPSGDLGRGMREWHNLAFPAIWVIPLFLFFAGALTGLPRPRFAYLRMLALLLVTTFPMWIVLQFAGMHRPMPDVPKWEIEAPSTPIHQLDFLSIFVPLMIVSVLSRYFRSERWEDSAAIPPLQPVVPQQESEQAIETDQ
jgi:hypothetical protein